MSIRCMIVDDEPISRDIVRRYLSKYDDFEVLQEAKNAFEALKLINESLVDVIFLDINMPKLSGLSMIKTLSPAPAIVFVTAYPEYAVQGFEVEALDYLVKPVSPERFADTIMKIRKKVARDREDHHIFVKADRKTFRVALNEIFYLKSNGDYIHVIRDGKSLITNESLKNMQQRLPAGQFVRTHKSYIVNLSYVKAFERGRIILRDIDLPVGDKYRENLRKKLKLQSGTLE